MKQYVTAGEQLAGSKLSQKVSFYCYLFFITSVGTYVVMQKYKILNRKQKLKSAIDQTDHLFSPIPIAQILN